MAVARVRRLLGGAREAVNAFYAGRIAAEQAKRRAAGLPEGGRMSCEHFRGASGAVSARYLYRRKRPTGGPWGALGWPLARVRTRSARRRCAVRGRVATFVSGPARGRPH